jgi:hypothetical protein
VCVCVCVCVCVRARVTQHHNTHTQGKPFRMDPASLRPQFEVKRDTLDKMTDKMEEMFTAQGRQAGKK